MQSPLPPKMYQFIPQMSGLALPLRHMQGMAQFPMTAEVSEAVDVAPQKCQTRAPSAVSLLTERVSGDNGIAVEMLPTAN